MGELDLNDDQKKIVNHVFGPILVLAPVGTGKTFVLAERVRRAIEAGIAADRILCLTFTNRAAGEMAARVREYHPEVASRLTVKTFHGMCARMLRIEARRIGLPQDFQIFDDADSMEILGQLFGLGERDARDLYYRIERIKVGDATATGLIASQLEAYQHELTKVGVLDFADLVCSAREMLANYSEIRDRWRNRFDFIQVDEVQDTHASEYAILKELGERSRNLALIGDIDQTIYEWRGSEPYEIIGMFQKDFGPVKEYTLGENYRATKILLEAASAFASTLSDRRTRIRAAASCGLGLPIGIHCAQTGSAEGAWIASMIAGIAREKMMPFRRIAVLGRTNARNLVISQELERSRIPCYTVELFEFFRRQEIKDALAILKLLVRPEDRWSLGRVLLRPPRGIGEATVRQIRTEGERSGLRLTDMVSPLLERDGEPFGRLIREADSGHLVILDVESTGLSLGQDEVVEIAATRLHGGRPGETFHRFIKNTVPVGESQSIHGWSDKFLQREGESPAEAFSALVNLIGASPVVGHYVRFDLGLIRAHARRVGVIVPEYETFDTWSMSSRLLPNLFDYRLETICQALHVKFRPQHKAEADVTATAELLLKLLPKIKEGAVERWGICSQYAGLFAPLAAMLSGLRAEINSLRPVEILERALALSGLYAYYEGKKEARRLEHLARLAAIFREKDDLSATPQDALAMLVEYAALAKNVDHILEGDDKVPIITMHQAKGLEFDVVFIAGASEGEIPSYLSLKEGRLEEEKRLFYVAMTRARKELYISSYSTHEKGFAKQPSRFISDIPANLVERL